MEDSTSQPDQPTARSLTAAFGRKEAIQSVLGLALAVLTLVYVLPWVAGTTWPQIGAQMQRLGWVPAAAMTALMLTGLASYTFTLSASLPGLSRRRAFQVNAAGSFVSNVLPGGGAVGVAITFWMFRSWGFARRAISTSLVVTGVWNLLGRLVLPVLAAAVLVFAPIGAPRPVIVAAGVATIMGLLVIGFFVAVLFSDRFAAEAGSAIRTLAAPLTRRFPALGTTGGLLADQRARVAAVVTGGGVPMTLGLAGMFAALFTLYCVSARTVGVDLALTQLFAAYAVRQFLTTVAITPGGLGLTEVGTAGVLVAFGADASAASAAALLFALFTHLLEVPLGVLAFGVWWFRPAKSGSTPTE